MSDPRLDKALTQILMLSKSTNNPQEIIANLRPLLQTLEMKKDEYYNPTEFERNKLTDRLSNFDYSRSPAWKIIKKKGWDNLNQRELLSIASILAEKCNITLDREAKRRKAILIKWFDENLSLLLPAIEFIRLEYDDQPIINTQ